MPSKTKQETGGSNASHVQVAAQVCPKLLSDGSLVHDVQILDGESIIEICAVSEQKALECAAAINHAIDLATINYAWYDGKHIRIERGVR